MYKSSKSQLILVSSALVGIVLILAALFLGLDGKNFFDLAWATSGTLVWPQGFTEIGNTLTPATQQKLGQDASIIEISLDVSNIPQGAVFDSCVLMVRDTAPTYPFILDVGCWHVTRQATTAPWNFKIDLRDTPIFLPKDTALVCQTTVYGGSAAVNSQIQHSCKVTYQDYIPGQPRYRALRFPYVDQVSNSDGTLAYSSYQSSSVFPLKVQGLLLFQSFGGVNASASAKPCLRWLKPDRTMVNQVCLPDQTISPAADYDSAAAIMKNINWTLPVGDLLDATCLNSRAGTDCAMYAIVEIPPSLISGPENVVRFYNNVPTQTSNDYCNIYAPTFMHPYFCGGQASCSSQTKINNCIALFPQATCLSTNTCTATTGELRGKTLKDDNGNGIADPGEAYIRDPSLLACPNPSYPQSEVRINYAGPASGSVLHNQCSIVSGDPIYSVNLPPGTYTVSVAPPNGWVATGPNNISVTVSAGLQTVQQFYLKLAPVLAPTLAFTASSGVIPFGGSTTVNWSSTNATSCTASGTWTGSKALVGAQSLAPFATATYTLSCSGSGESVTKSVTVTVLPPPDLAPPVISSISATNITTTTAAVSWITNEPATGQVEYGRTTSYGLSTFNSSFLTSRTVALSSLSPGTIYNFRVRSKDASGNEAVSTNQTFATQSETPPDTFTPAAIQDLAASNLTETSATFSFTASGDDGLLGTAKAFDLRYSTTNISEAAFSSALKAPGLPAPQASSTKQTYVLVGLTAGTRYYAAIKSEDEAGNISAISNIVVFQTLSSTALPPDVTPPPQVPSFSGKAADSQVALVWENPSSDDWVRTIILRKQGSAPASPADGRLIYDGGGQSFVDLGLPNDLVYYYGAFTLDRVPNYSNPVVISAIPRAGQDQISFSQNRGEEITTRPEGTLIKYPGDPTVYVIEGGNKRPIPSYEIYEREFSGRPIAVISQVLQYPTGPAVKFSAGALLKSSTSPTVYLIVDNESKYAFKSAQEFARFGYRFDLVKTASEQDLALYSNAAFLALTYHATGNLVKYPDSATVYRIENRTKRGFSSRAVFLSYARFSQVLTIDPSFQYPDGPVMGFPEGALLKGSGLTVYLIENSMRRPFTEAASFFKLGYSFSQVRQVSEQDLTLHLEDGPL